MRGLLLISLGVLAANIASGGGLLLWARWAHRREQARVGKTDEPSDSCGTPEEDDRPQPRCAICGRPGHNGDECPEKRPPTRTVCEPSTVAAELASLAANQRRGAPLISAPERDSHQPWPESWTRGGGFTVGGIAVHRACWQAGLAGRQPCAHCTPIIDTASLGGAP